MEAEPLKIEAISSIGQLIEKLENQIKRIIGQQK